MTRALRIQITIIILGICGSLAAQTSGTPLSHDALIKSVSSKKNPFPDPSEDLFIAYPNPLTTDIFSIELEHTEPGALLIQVYNLVGRLYYVKTIEKTEEVLEYNIDTSGWTPGMYVIAITGKGFRGSQRVLKE